MKKIFLIGAALLFACTTSFAGNSNLFSYDKQDLNAEFQTISELELVIEQSSEMSFEQLMISNEDLSNELVADGFNTSPMNMHSFGIDWGSFFWGLCCWPAGIFTVVLNSSKTTGDKISYLIGVGVFLLLGGTGGAIYY